MTPHMHLYVLASGSKGNAAVVEGPEGSVLVDCGISRKMLREREVVAPLEAVNDFLHLRLSARPAFLLPP